MGKERRPRRRVGLVPALVLFGLLELVCLAALPTYLRAPVLDWRSRAVCTAGILSLPVLALLGLTTLRRAVDELVGRWRSVRLALAVLTRPVLWFALFLACVSWQVFWRTGSFVSVEMLRFFLTQPRLILAHLTPTEWLAFLAGVGLAGMVLWLALASTRPPPAGADRSSYRSLLLATVIPAGLFWFALVTYPGRVLGAEESAEYLHQACFRSTPGLALLCSYAVEGGDGPPVEVALRPIEPIASWAARAEASPDRRRLNVVFVGVESWRRDSIDRLPDGRALMPFVDRLVGDSLVFPNAYAQSSATDYAFPNMLASLYAFKGYRHESFAEIDYPKTMIYDVLAAAGYHTAIYSSHNEGWLHMDHFLGTPALEVFFHAGTWNGEGLQQRQDSGVWTWVKEGLLQREAIDDRVTVSKFLEWVGSLPAGDPFFAQVSLRCTHFPYAQPEAGQRPFEPSEMDFDVSFMYYPPERVEVMRNRYRNALRLLDDRIRELVEGLDRQGRLDRTVLVLVGDHGEEFHEHGVVTHAQSMYEDVLRIPLVIHAPALGLRGSDPGAIQQIDLPPTMLGLLGLPRFPGWQGSDVLAPGFDAEGHKLFLTCQHMVHQNVLIWKGYKYVLDRDGDDRFIHLADDPLEENNLITRLPALARVYEREINEWMHRQVTYYGDEEYYRGYYPPQH